MRRSFPCLSAVMLLAGIVDGAAPSPASPVDKPQIATVTVVGLSYFSFGFAVMLLYAVIRTIPRQLEEAAIIHGAGRLRTFWRILLPLSLPGVAGGFLTVFNLCMGAFTSAALLGAGRVLTLPVLIERTILGDMGVFLVENSMLVKGAGREVAVDFLNSNFVLLQVE